MKNPVRQNILSIKPYVPGKPIEEVRRELGLKKVIKLASNENCLGLSPKAVDAIRRNIRNLNRYPDASSFYLKKALASSLGVKEGDLIIGNGSDEIIVIAIRTFVNEGDEVIIARPTFLIYEIASRIQNARLKLVPLTKSFRHDLKAMRDAVTADTKMVFIANPDNPTGTYVTKAELDDFFKGLPQDVIVFLDEAYFEFANFGSKNYPNGLDYLARPNVIVARSFSKVYGLAGLRLGYGISNRKFIDYMERVRDPFNVNSLAQAAGLAALEDRKFLKKTLSHTEREKRFLYSAFRRMKIGFVESATNFVIFDIERDSKEIFNKLLERGVIVRDMKAWGFNTYLRVTVGTREENILFVDALERALLR